MNAHEMELAAFDEFNPAQQAAIDAGDRDAVIAATDRLRQRLAEIEPVKAAERETARQHAQEQLKAIMERRAQIIANVRDCDAMYDVDGMLSLLNEIREEGFLYPEEDYLREILALIRK